MTRTEVVMLYCVSYTVLDKSLRRVLVLNIDVKQRSRFEKSWELELELEAEVTD